MHEYIKFVEQPTVPTRRTKVIHVQSKSSGALLGMIKWYGAWRQYCFYPEGLCIFSRGCMRDINAAIDTLMDQRHFSVTEAGEELT